MSRAVIKLGGSVLSDTGLRKSLIAQIATLRGSGVELVVVHGGGKQIASMLARLHIESRFHDGLRITDERTRDVAQMVLAGKVGKDLVAELSRVSVKSASLAGGDGLSFLAERLRSDDGADLGYVGRVVSSQSSLIDALLAIGIIPIIACIALGASDGEYYNINGDHMASAVAAGCRATELILVTDVGGVRDERGAQIASLGRARINELLASGVASGGMRPKLRACLEALVAGVERIRIVGAQVENVLVRAIVEGEHVGTLIAG
jgi:acetylglutamate kinase